MKDYLLFLDTEASGLPKNWNLPYSVEDNWPYCVQVSWIIYTNNSEKIKLEDHYIKDNDFEISKSSIEVHGITREFLCEKGELRQEVFTRLANDLKKYDPLVIGHFMDFDFHMVSADFFRAGIENPLEKEQTFCTMRSTSNLVQNPNVKYFRLGDLYTYLFNTTLKNQHNALVDATATATCFFELVKRGEITDEKIEQQQKTPALKSIVKPSGCFLPILIFIVLLTLLTYYNL